jgi:hypothetical protein
MRTVLGLSSLVLSLACMGALGLWVYQAIALSALVAMQRRYRFAREACRSDVPRLSVANQRLG